MEMSEKKQDANKEIWLTDRNEYNLFKLYFLLKAVKIPITSTSIEEKINV